MSEQENIQLTRQAIAHLNAREMDRYMQLIDDSYVGENEIAPGPIRGPEGARQQLNTILSAFPDLRLEIEQIIASGDNVVTRVRVTGTHKGTFAGFAPTNKTVSWGGCNVIEIRNGKVIRSRLYADNASILRQIGALSIPMVRAAG
jgi:steroid delta-isomerase-like uncharacterized protein